MKKAYHVHANLTIEECTPSAEQQIAVRGILHDAMDRVRALLAPNNSCSQRVDHLPVVVGPLNQKLLGMSIVSVPEMPERVALVTDDRGRVVAGLRLGGV